MKTLKNTLLILSILFFGLKVNAQKDNSVPCATDELHFEMLKNSSKYQQQFEDNNRNYRDFLAKYQNNDIQRLAGNTVTTLNIVFHDLSQTNTFINTVNNDIGDYQYIVNGLNSIFSGNNLNGLPGNDTMLQFCLARTDSNGDAYTLNELQTANVAQAVLNRDFPLEIQAITLAANTANLFPTTQYMNVYIVDEIIDDTAGFAYLPSAHGIPVDGIYIERELVQIDPDYNTDMTSVAHEIGHYLGLFHIFGICDPDTIFEECSCNDDDCTFNGDMICDTPPTEIPDSQMDYCTVVDPMSCGTPVNDVQRTNFMNYFNNECRSTFTDGQIERMCFMLDPEFGPRQSILNNLTCVDCIAMDGCEFDIDPNFNNNETTEDTLISFTATSQNCTENPTPDIEYTWQVINLDTEDTEDFTGATISDLVLTIGNYTLQLTATLASNNQCIEQVAYNFQVLPAANAICNVEAPVNNTDWLNWNRVSYTNGWAVNPNPNIPFGNEWDATAPFNSNDFQHPTTQRTAHSSTDVVPNFDVVSSLINDTNFNTNPTAINIPAGLTNVIRVGDIIDTASIPPGAKANYTSITLNPTADQAKFRIHYIGVTAQNENYSINHWDLFDDVDYPTAFGWFLRYRYDSPVDLDTNIQNNKDIGVHENNINNTTDYSLNDFISRNTNCPNNNINPVTEETIGGYNYDVMNNWRFVDIDLSEFVNHPNLPFDDDLNTEVTITFFSRTNNDVAAINNSYAYFGVECLGGGLPQNITLEMEDLVIPCNIEESCIETEPLVLEYDYSRHRLINKELYDINTVRIQESLDNITFTNSSSNFEINSRRFTICLDDDPFKFYRVTLNTLHQTITDTFTVSRGFFFDNNCPGDTNNFAGGDIIGDPNIPLVLCENDIQPIVLELTDPCYLNPTYQWFINNDGNPIDYDIDGDGIIDGSDNLLNINSNIFLNRASNQFLEIYRIATVIDPFCGQESTYKSEVFRIFNLNNYIVEIRNWQNSINDLCFGQDLNIDLEVRVKPFLYNNGNPTDLNNHNYDQFLVDNNLNTTPGFINLTLWIDDVAIETVPINYNEGLNPTNPNNLNPFQFNTLPVPFSTISNLLPTLNGNYNISFTATSNFNGCDNLDASLSHPSIPLSVDPAATGGNIDLTVHNCEQISLSSIDDGFSFQDTYVWEFSTTPDFSTNVNVIPVTTANVVNLDISTFNTFPVFFRRTSQAFPVCPNVSIHSNIITLNAIALTTPTFNLLGPFCSSEDILSLLPTNSTNQPAIVGSWTNIEGGLFTFTPNDNQCAASLTLDIEISNCNECLDCNAILEETLIKREEKVCGAYTAVVPKGISDCYRVDYYINNVLQGQLPEGTSLVNFTSNGIYELEIVVVDITVEPENTCAKRSEEITVTCFDECPDCNNLFSEIVDSIEPTKNCGEYQIVVPEGLEECYKIILTHEENEISLEQGGTTTFSYTENGSYSIGLTITDLNSSEICDEKEFKLDVTCFEECLNCNDILEDVLFQEEEKVCGAYTAVVPKGISDCYRVDYYINNILQGQLPEGASLVNFTSNGTYELEIVVVDITIKPEVKCAKRSEEITVTCFEECPGCNAILEETSIKQEEKVCGAYTAVVPKGISDCYRVDYYINNVLQGQLPEGTSLVNFTSNGTYELEIVVVDITVEPENTCAKRSEEITVTCFEECPSCSDELTTLDLLNEISDTVTQGINCGEFQVIVSETIAACFDVKITLGINEGYIDLVEGNNTFSYTYNGSFSLGIYLFDINTGAFCSKLGTKIDVNCFEDCEVDVYNDFSSADVTYADGDQCTAFPFTHFYGPANGPFPWKATIYYAAYHVLLTEDFYDNYNCNVLLNQGTGTNIWMNPHRIKTPPSGHESVMAYWNKSKNTDTNLSGVHTQIENLEPNTTYQIEFYDLPVRTHAPGRQTANLYYNTKVSFANQEWNGPDTYYTDDYNYWHLRTMTFTTDATTTSTTLTLQFPLEPDLNNPVNDGYIAIDDIKITCLADGTTKENTNNQSVSNVKNEITIYPNPTTGLFQLKLDNPKDSITEIEIYNIQGLRVMSTPYSKGKNIDISRLQNGVYFIKTTLESQNQITKKIIKK